MSQPVNKNKSLLLNFFSFLALFYVLIVALPVTVLLVNYKEMEVGFADLAQLGSNFLMASPFAVALTLLFFKVKRAQGFVATLICTILILSIFVPNQSGTLDGVRDSSIFAFSSTSYIELAKFIGIFALLFLFGKKSPGNFNLIYYLLLIASVGQLSYLGFELSSLDQAKLKEQEKQQVLLQQRIASGEIGQFSMDPNLLSNKKNVIIIGYDGLQGDIVEDVLQENPQLIENFSGFKIYPNASGTAPNTTRSNFLTTLGKIPPLLPKRDDWFRKYAKEILPYVISKEAGFEATSVGAGTRCHPDRKNFECYQGGIFLAKNPEYKRKSADQSIYLFSLMRVIPPSFAQSIYQNVNKLGLRGKTDFQMSDEDTGKHKHGRALYEHISFVKYLEVVDKAPTFVYHHYVFSHQPSTFDENCKYHMSQDVVQGYASAKAEVTCAIKEMGRLVAKLKKIKGYENSLVFFISDHGYEANMNMKPVTKPSGFVYKGNTINYKGNASISRYNPVLFYKDFGATGKAEILPHGVSLLDIYATVCDRIKMNCDRLNLDGVSLEQSAKERTRKFILYQGEKGLPSEYFRSMTSFSIQTFKGNVREELQALFEKTHSGESVDAFRASKVITCRESIFFGVRNRRTKQNVTFSGLNRAQPWGRTAKTKEVKVYFKFESDNCNAKELNIYLKGSANPKAAAQKIQILINGSPVSKITLKGGKKRPRKFKVPFDPALIRPGQATELTFQIENLKGPKVGFRTLKFR
ncbi:MAG: sulfatase-like hydrolase/transferase [SAR324 cluster bacterium]|nr:sulfatase-like hydrolase/transferase [SAR324 cluster bacterium]